MIGDLNRTKGVVYGLAIGDALGRVTEFMSLHHIRSTYGEDGITDLAEPALFTDDTQMSVAIAEALPLNRDPATHGETGNMKYRKTTGEEFGKRSVCRNPLIANLLLRCDYIEKMGTGIERIWEALERENCPKVNIRFNTMFTLEFPRPTYVKAKDETSKTSEKTSEEILRLIAKNQRTTISELAEAIGVTTRSIERNIKNLQAYVRLRRAGPDKGGHWVITEW